MIRRAILILSLVFTVGLLGYLNSLMQAGFKDEIDIHAQFRQSVLDSSDMIFIFQQEFGTTQE